MLDLGIAESGSKKEADGSNNANMEALRRHLAEALASASGSEMAQVGTEEGAGGSAARKLAARLRCELAVGGDAAGAGGVTGAVAAALGDPAYEARKAAAKVLLRTPQQVWTRGTSSPLCVPTQKAPDRICATNKCKYVIGGGDFFKDLQFLSLMLLQATDVTSHCSELVSNGIYPFCFLRNLWRHKCRSIICVGTFYVLTSTRVLASHETPKQIATYKRVEI